MTVTLVFWYTLLSACGSKSSAFPSFISYGNAIVVSLKSTSATLSWGWFIRKKLDFSNRGDSTELQLFATSCRQQLYSDYQFHIFAAELIIYSIVNSVTRESRIGIIIHHFSCFVEKTFSHRQAWFLVCYSRRWHIFKKSVAWSKWLIFNPEWKCKKIKIPNYLHSKGNTSYP